MRSEPDPTYPTASRADTFQCGLQFQDFVCDALAKDHIILQNLCSKRWQWDVGENLQGFEIKYDERGGPGGASYGTGNVGIECYEKSHSAIPTWTPSGILRDDNSWLYIVGNYKHLFVFGKRILRQLHDCGRYKWVETLPTMRTILMPWADAQRYTLKFYDFARGE